VANASDPLSRAEVAAVTGLTRATVSTLVDRLMLAGILAELPPIASGGAGRPAVPLVPAARTLVGLGLAVDVDYLAAALVDLTGETIQTMQIQGDFRASQPEAVLGQLRELAGNLIERAEDLGLRIVGANLALPGLVDAELGILRVAPNLGWSEVNISELFQLPGITCKIANDAKLAALAEVDSGESDSFIYLAGDLGIGGAIVVNGELFGGEHGWSGEVGHVIVDPSGPLCGCGANGCLETIAGKAALMAAAGLPTKAPITELCELLDAGSGQAYAALNGASKAIGAVLCDLINVMDLPTVVFGGDFAPLLPYMSDDLSAQIASRVLSAPYTSYDMRPSEIGPFPAAIGGARTAVRDLIANPTPWC
jgi:predicted NBD/HSP70 family sugar kinase